MKKQIEGVLRSVLPDGVYLSVTESSGFGGVYYRICIAAKDYDINGVSGQKPQLVSLILYPDTMELKPQIYGGCGGQSVYRKPNLLDDKEKYLYMKNITLPFRKPRPNFESVLKCIKGFGENWVKTLRENKDVLMYQQYVDYNSLL